MEQFQNQEVRFVITNPDATEIRNQKSEINDATDSSFPLMLLQNVQKQYTFKTRYSRLNCGLQGDKV